MDELFECNKLSKSYLNKKVFENLELKIRKKSIFQVCGQNGSGKTTLLKILSGLDKDYSGTVNFNNKEIQNIENDFYKDVLFLLSVPSFYNDLSLRKNLEFFSKIYQNNINFDDDLMNLLNLKKILNENITNLSDGQRKKGQLFFAISISPKVLIFDEPFNFIDDSTQEIIQNYIKKINNNKDSTIIFSDNSIRSYQFEINRKVDLKNV